MSVFNLDHIESSPTHCDMCTCWVQYSLHVYSRADTQLN